MTEINCIICNENYRQSDDVLFFADNDMVLREEIYHAPENTTIYDLLVRLGIFASKTEARKNWKRGDIKPGYQEFKKIGKYNKSLFIYNPTGD